MSELSVTAGHVAAMRLFDIADEIDLARAETLWTRHAAGRATRARLAVTKPQARGPPSWRRRSCC